MSKYTRIKEIIHTLFSTPTWVNQDITTVPSNFTGSPDRNEFVRLHIIYGKPYDEFQSLDQLEGLIMIEIYTPVGYGPDRYLEISSALDTLLQGYREDNFQTYKSSLTINGKDRDNPNLFRTTYSIQFSYYGA